VFAALVLGFSKVKNSAIHASVRDAASGFCIAGVARFCGSCVTELMDEKLFPLADHIDGICVVVCLDAEGALGGVCAI